MNNFNVFSFDVFDTCISRTYEKPADLFYHLGTLICSNKIDATLRNNFSNEFSKARILAEKLACRSHGRRRSCRLNEIYSLLSVPTECQYSKCEIMDFELQLEERFTYGIKSTKNIIDNLRKEGKRIIFISDMYLEASFIKKQLIKHGFFEEGDGLYVSSESTLIKRTGMLFKLVLKNENIQAQDLFHTGDNLTCDIRSANRLGIQTAHIRNTHIPFHEVIFSDSKFTPVEKRINSISKYIRLSNSDIYTAAESRLFSVIAPAVISFTLWALQTALQMGLNRVYFVARNGELPYKVAELFRNYFPQIEIKFLYGSRRAWLLPSISTQSPEWEFVVPKKSACSIREALERLSLAEAEISDIDSIAKSKGISIDDVEKSGIILNKFMKIIEDSAAEDLIQFRMRNAKDLTVEYLSQEGLLNDDLWAIVDSGWALNCQAHLNRIVKSVSPHHEVKGLYFGMVPKHLPKKVTGPAFSFTDKLSIFSQRGYVVENCFLFSALQSTCAYIRNDDNIVPELSKLTQSQFELNYSDKIYSFIEEYLKTVNSIELPLSLFSEYRDTLIENLTHLISKPDNEVAQYVSNLKINENFSHTDGNSYPLSRKLTIVDLAQQVFGFFSPRVKRQQIWLEASICLSNPIIGFLFRSLIYANRVRYIISNCKIKHPSS